MITSDSAQILKAYTTLRDGVQGSLVKRAGGFELWGDVQRVGNTSNQVEVWTNSHAVNCVLKATFHDSLSEAGTLREGPFVFQGESLQNHGKQIVLGRVLQGPDTAAENPKQLVLVSFLDTDIVKCSTTEEIPFATANTSSPLAPPWAYIEPVFSGKFNKVLAACAGGCYIIDTLNTLTTQAQYARSLLSNLMNIDVVVFAPGTPAVIYRLATNAILAGPADYEDKMQELQSMLQLPASAVIRNRLPSAGDWQISASMADSEMLRDGVAVTVQQIRDSASTLLVYSQPLVGWQLPERRLIIDITINHSSISQLTIGNGVRLNLKPWMAKGLRMGVQTSAKSVKFSPLRPGETDQSQKDSLERIINENAQSTLLFLSVEGGKGSLDAVTRQLTNNLTGALNQSGLFPSPVTVQVSTDLVITKGEAVRLHTGSVVMIPEYACSASSARMTCLTSIIAAGIKLSFIPWSKTKQGFSIL